ncbi:unnamed protein product [Acanthoscelides obtectus]|uniref:Uncharacterized protein n=1 Tax=Acanthoscelides obtectus TaxID=200917 RepID=A0A9P0QFC8_ACAOB|nr:unnamed protein product [Acanthoscelides obtectus]CAK1688571.1 Cyclin-dependent kinase 2 [Acanthoscelides obtectus]
MSIQTSLLFTCRDLIPSWTHLQTIQVDIFHFQFTKRAIFPGDSEIDQLYKIFKILGTPSEAYVGVQSI